VSSETGEWVRSTVQYPGWIPVAADRKTRRARFVPSPYPAIDEGLTPVVAAGAPGAAPPSPGVGAAGPGLPGGPTVPAPVGAGPPRDPGVPTPAPTGGPSAPPRPTDAGSSGSSGPSGAFNASDATNGRG
jgi:hypothetical protein